MEEARGTQPWRVHPGMVLLWSQLANLRSVAFSHSSSLNYAVLEVVRYLQEDRLIVINTVDTGAGLLLFVVHLTRQRCSIVCMGCRQGCWVTQTVSNSALLRACKRRFRLQAPNLLGDIASNVRCAYTAGQVALYTASLVFMVKLTWGTTLKNPHQT